jgi:hypothetical protein
MSGATYRAVLYGPGNIGSGQEVDLDYGADGQHQDIVVVDVVEGGETIRRTFRRGHETAEPVPYRFVEESDTGGEPNVPN